MLSGELALRVATAAILLVVGLVFLRDRARMDFGPFGGLLALSVAVGSVIGVRSLDWMWPLQILAMGTPALLWIWASAIFDDDFRPGWREALAWALLPVIGVFNLYARQRWIGTVQGLLDLGFVLLAAGRALAGLRDDLLERRRRLRRLLATLAALYSAGQFHGHRRSRAAGRRLRSHGRGGPVGGAGADFRAGRPARGKSPQPFAGRCAQGVRPGCRPGAGDSLKPTIRTTPSWPGCAS